MGASSLSALHLPPSVESIGTYAFNGCGIKDLSLPDGVSVGWRAFRGNPLVSVEVGRGVKYERWSLAPRTPKRCQQFWMCAFLAFVGLLGAAGSGQGELRGAMTEATAVCGGQFLTPTLIAVWLKVLCGLFGMGFMGVYCFIAYVSPAFDRGVKVVVKK